MAPARGNMGRQGYRKETKGEAPQEGQGTLKLPQVYYVGLITGACRRFGWRASAPCGDPRCGRSSERRQSNGETDDAANMWRRRAALHAAVSSPSPAET
ncbi:hypothetical protein EYF80_039372 [Liparis tanakae]|uniref:Uncharacterized protein n=1 Tax=Liparis tanakae TaxID=230148 RepID=A0A4Z2GA37_9TELE|nr:hypothetical protein EYF80_039372 [Liparis tanakae]